MKCIQFDRQKEYIRDFIRLPRQLYSRTENMENPEEVQKFLLGTHPLSKYFAMHKFLVYDGEKAVGRFVITVYPGDEAAYIGFFECVDDSMVAAFLFRMARDCAKSVGCTKLVGPVNASFWTGYRLKSNLFDEKPYTGEPYNKEYYLKLFQDNGFQVCHHYTSNGYGKVETVDALYDDRYLDFLKKGYRIVSPKIWNFRRVTKELYELITDLYSDFPVYKDVEYKDFAAVFSDYRYIINMSMVKMAYYDGRPVGFFVSVPDYGNSVYHLNSLPNLIKLLVIRRKPKRYVMLYMGVHQEHRGLGKALVGCIMDELKKSGLSSIGALAGDGKPTQKYGEEHIERQYEYVLLEQMLEKEQTDKSEMIS